MLGDMYASNINAITDAITIPKIGPHFLLEIASRDDLYPAMFNHLTHALMHI